MNLIIELLCPSCSQGKCLKHKYKTLTKDSITGLEFEVRCVCTKHSINGDDA
jgi:hypothetical protein